jgi:hypothetical protein
VHTQATDEWRLDKTTNFFIYIILNLFEINDALSIVCFKCKYRILHAISF